MSSCLDVSEKERLRRKQVRYEQDYSTWRNRMYWRMRYGCWPTRLYKERRSRELFVCLYVFDGFPDFVQTTFRLLLVHPASYPLISSSEKVHGAEISFIRQQNVSFSQSTDLKITVKYRKEMLLIPK